MVEDIDYSAIHEENAKILVKMLAHLLKVCNSITLDNTFAN